ncbi:MAG TPA: MarR family transcriptional regulator [Solirubrobacteraceae bacterium]|nr:MarR family transcriptional regulator [Solirubrobacteraceae bacterium]
MHTTAVAPPATEPAVGGAWGQLLRVMLDLWPYYLARCAAHDLPPVQAQALLRMHDRAEMKMRDLAEVLSLDPSTVTGVVDRLEARGLVERQIAPDRRAKILSLTDEGWRVRASLLDSLGRAPGLIAGLHPERQHEIAEALALIGGPCNTFPIEELEEAGRR